MIEAVLAGAAAGLASIPHCAAMCGSIAAGACAERRSGALYLGARLASYTMLGALLGTLGHAATALFASRLYSQSERKLNTIQGFLDLLAQ